MDRIPIFRVFLSSPGDVSEERQAVLEVLERLPNRPAFREKVAFRVVAWDKIDASVPMLASMSPQAAIDAGLPKPSECDIVVVIFWSRMGTPFEMNGVKYLSGTHYELMDVLSNPLSIPMIYRRKEKKLFEASDDEGIAQYKRVQNFFKSELFYEPTTQQIRRGKNDYNNPTDFKAMFETHLEEVVVRLLNRSTPTPESISKSTQPAHPTSAVETQMPLITTKNWEGSPFPGLRSFKKEDAPIFFGRERETAGLVKKVAESRFVAVVGASGSGKSSLVGAGLLPSLEANAINNETTGSKGWYVVQFTPGQSDHPFAALYMALVNTFEQLRPVDILELTPRKQKFVKNMLSNPATVCDGLSFVLDRIKAPQWVEVLLFIDQFEELFTVAKEEEIEPFCRMLSLMAEHPRLRVVVTVRHDFVHRAVEIPELAELLNRGFFSLAAPTTRALELMIKHPAEAAGLVFDTGLDSQILRDTSNEPGALALMAYLLDELYKIADKRGDRKLSFADYEALGKVEGAIGRRAEQTFNSLSGTEEEKVRLLGRVFRELVEVNEEGKATRRRAAYSCFEREELALIEAFTQARLLVRDQEQVEVAHEALFRSWERLAHWIAERQEDFILRRQVRNAAAEWKSKNYREYLRWPQERLEPVYAMQARLEWKPDEIEAKFIEPEQERLLREIHLLSTTEVRRRDIGDRLSVIGDTREGIGVRENGTTDILWLPVTPWGKLEIEKKKFEVEPYYISKYLVTYRQYEAFVEAKDGYNNLEWWQGMPKEYQRQELSEQRMKSWNNPRDSVSWYQSMAFSRWLNHRLRGWQFPHPEGSTKAALIIGQNAEVRLPKEWEWQWAAQGGQEWREYPWGKWEKGYANTSASGLNRAVGVGLYPHGAAKCGALDMSGNLLEWCLNKYEKPEQVQADSSGDSRVLRGGSFFNYSGLASCAYRSIVDPDDVNLNYGFRVVLVFSGL